jgi:hypothetical protein
MLWPAAYPDAMRVRTFHWGRAIGGATLGEALQIAVAFLWVAIYSYLLNPGQAMDVYHAHAQASAPWVAILAGAPIFYAVSRWIARTQATALALFAAFVFIDGSFVVLSGATLSASDLALLGASYSTKLVACMLGGCHGSWATAASTA